MKSTIWKTAAMLLAVGSPVAAEGWSIIDFNTVADRPTCVRYAESAARLYGQRFPAASDIVVSDGTVGAYGLRGRAVDGLFICVDAAGLVTPLLVVHNSDDDSEARVLIADRLADAWDEVVATGGFVGGGSSTSK